MGFQPNLWDERKSAVMKVRAKILEAARSWFKRHGYLEVHGPILIPAFGELSSNLEVKYFDGRAYLMGGLYPYTEVFAANLGKVYTISPVFRPEKVKTSRHLIEYWRIEAAFPDGDMDRLLQVEEELVCYISRSLVEEAREELKIVGRDIEDLKRVRPPFPRLTYDEAIKILQEDGFKVYWGMMFSWEHERCLSLRFNKPFFILEFPIGIETYFYQTHPERQYVTLTVDLLAPEGYGELSSGGQPIIDKGEFLRRMKEERLSPEEQRWYLDLKKIGSTPHFGFALGVERLTQWICKLEHIKEATAFPRSVDDFYP